MCTQSCPTLCNPMDYRPPDSSVHGFSQARILEWVALSLEPASPVSPTLQADSLTLSHRRSSMLFLMLKTSSLFKDHFVSGLSHSRNKMNTHTKPHFSTIWSCFPPTFHLSLANLLNELFACLIVLINLLSY